jgi:hypothetical protein
VKVLAASLLLLCIAAVPAIAQTLYDNGPINGTTDGWTINFGFAVSNSFFVLPSNATITGMSFGAWLFPGDVLESAEILIGTSEFDGSLFDGVTNFTQSNCVGNQYGFNVCTESSTFNGPSLVAGVYWLTLENAIVNTGDPVYWDENSGEGCTSNLCPSQASENSVGTIPSEAFTLLGSFDTTTTSTSGTVPEPSSVMLFGSGVLGLAGLLRRKLF